MSENALKFNSEMQKLSSESDSCIVDSLEPINFLSYIYYLHFCQYNILSNTIL